MGNSPRYGTNSQNTSEFMKHLINEFNKMPHGVFNETRRKILDIPLYGIIPVECWEMLPNSDVYVSYDIQMITKNPTIKRLLSGMNVELRVYSIDYNDCWEGWNDFITKGRSGKITKSVPYVDLSLGTDTHTTSLPYSPMHLLSLAPTTFLAADTDGKKFTVPYNEGVQAVSGLQTSGLSGIDTLAKLKASTAMRVNALPFVFYNKIAKKYQNSNLLQDNPHWYPENENHDQILPYSATGAVTTSDYDNPTKSFVSGTSIVQPSAQESSGSYESYPWLNVLWYSQRKGDYFNTGSPFPDLIRGDIPTIQAIEARVDWDSVLAPSGSYSGEDMRFLAFNQSNGKLFDAGGFSTTSQTGNISVANPYAGFSVSNRAKLLESLNEITLKGIEFSMRQWRYLATMNVMKERMALTDGSYNGLIEAMFGHNPRWHNHEPKYCGGTRQPIVFTEVVNTAETDNAPLGDTAGRAVTSQNGNTIHVHADDFGMFMTVLVITPDEYHSQGVDKMFSRLENALQYFPILNNLSPDATQNKELFVSGTNDTDEDVFNYQERFAYYKSRRNQVSGLMALPISKIGDIGAFLQNRLFSSTPSFNAEFNRGDLTDNEKAIFASTNQAPFCAVIGSNMKYIAPIPEDSRPTDFGISY